MEEVFVRICATAGTRARTLFSILKDVICPFNLRMKDYRGKCYDGAENVSGKSSGHQALVPRDRTKSFACALPCAYTEHVCKICARKLMSVGIVSLLTNLVNFVRTSPKRLSWFQQFQNKENPALRQFCKAKCTLKARSFRLVSTNSSKLTRFLFTLSSEEKNDTGAKASSYARTLKKFNAYFLLRLMLLVFERLESVNTAL